jgi:hypothetical protein
MEGPYRYRGTMGGRPVTGFGIAEATNAMYRDWELVDVLATQVARKDSESQNWESAIEELRALIARRDATDVLDYLDREMRPLLSVRYPTTIPVGCSRYSTISPALCVKA